MNDELRITNDELRMTNDEGWEWQITI